MREHPDQSLLVAVDIRAEAHVLAALGDRAREEVKDVGPALCDLGIDGDDHPKTPGLHVWDGTIGEATIHDYLLVWDGTWRPATLADFARFGVAAPAEAP